MALTSAAFKEAESSITVVAQYPQYPQYLASFALPIIAFYLCLKEMSDKNDNEIGPSND